MAPGAGHAGRFAEQMVEQHIGRAGRARGSEIADHAVEPEQRLGELAFEVAVEDLGRAAHREVVDDPRLGERQAGHVAAEAQQLGNRADLPPDVGRRTQQPFLQQPDDRLQLGKVAVVGLAVGLHVPGDLLARQPAAAGQQVIAVAGEEIVGLPQHDL